MAVKMMTQNGLIEMSNDVIATVVGGAATDVFGIVGMASKKQIKDNIDEILRKENYSKGVVVRQEEKWRGSRCVHNRKLWDKDF